MSDATEIIEQTAEEAIELVETIEEFDYRLALIGVGIGSALLGGFIGYKIAKKRLETVFEERLAEEIAFTKHFYAGKPGSPEDVVKDLIEEEEEADVALYSDTMIAYDKAHLNEGTHIVVEREEVSVELDLANEIRSPEHPYVVDEEEFMENEDEYDQVSITYYLGDGVLADEREEPIPEIHGTVGLDNLKRFGVGSKDPRIVHIRSERLRTDFEVILSDGLYSEEVLGLPSHRRGEDE